MFPYFRHNEMTLTDFYRTLESDVEYISTFSSCFKEWLEHKDVHDFRESVIVNFV